MKTRFVEYLKNLAVYSHQKNKILLDAMHGCVTTAETSHPVALGRVFNDFPLRYEVEKQWVYVVDLNILKDWIERFENIIQEKQFEFNLEKEPHVTAPPEITDQIKKILVDIINQGCIDLLNKNGDFKQEIIDFFGMKNLVNKHKKNIILRHEAIYAMLFSYCTQLINANFTDIFCNHKKLDVDQVDMLNTKFREFCIDNKKKSLYSNFFINKILHFIYGKNIYSLENFAEVVAVSSFQSLPSIVRLDVEEKQEICHSTACLARKTESWFDVLNVLKSKHLMMRHQAIYQGLPKNSQAEWEDSPDGFPPLSHFEMLAWQKKLIVGNKYNANPDVNHDNRSLREFLLIRDNSFLVDFLVQKVELEKKLITTLLKKSFKRFVTSVMVDEIIKSVMSELQNSKFTPELLAQSMPVFIENVYHISKYKGALAIILQSYAPELTQHLGLNFAFEDKNIINAIQNNDWIFAVSVLVNITFNDLTPKEFSIVHANRHRLTQELIVFLEQKKLTCTESLKLVNDVLENKNALGALTKISSNAWAAWASTLINKATQTTPLQMLLKLKSQLEESIKLVDAHQVAEVSKSINC